MIIVTRQTRANQACEAWRRQYRGITNIKWAHIGDQLEALGPTPNPDDVDRIIGNGSWTDTPTCDECDATHNGPRVRVGSEPDYDSATAHLCRRCIKKAAALMESRQ